MTEVLARVSARRPLVTIAIWVVVLVIALGLNANLLDSATTTELRLTGAAESQVAANILEERLRGPEPINEVVIVRSGSLTVDDQAFREKVESVYESIISLGPDVVSSGENFYQGNSEALVSDDRKTTIMPIVMTGSLADAERNVESVLNIVSEADGDGDFRVLMGGTASISWESNELATHDLEQGERFGVPVAMIILLVLFGTIIAALVPIGLAIVAIIVALALVAVIGQYFELVFFVTLMITMIGLAVGIDYSLFIISRFREEMHRTGDKLEAVAKTGDTAGRTVLFSGLTVVIALIGMLIVPASFFQSLGLGAILVVLAALAATLTLLPAVLGLLGTKVNLLPLPIFGKSKIAPKDPSHSSTNGFWDVTTRAVTRVPVLSILVIAIPMIILTYFYFEIETGINGVDTFPEGAHTREAFFVLEEDFSFGLIRPVEIVIDGDIANQGVQEGISSLAKSIRDDPSFPNRPVVLNPRSGELALITVVIPGEPSSHKAVDAVKLIRNEFIPAAFDGTPAEVYVGGPTALAADLFDVVRAYTPIVFAFVLGFSFIVLMLVFRSIVIPIKAVIMNLLSVGASYGLLVLVFQKGVATDLFGFQHAEVIDTWIPLFLFSILFGLSMDYHVFLLSRVRERYDQTGDNAEAVAYGLKSTAGIITGAALIMVAVFGAFASGQTIINQQVGFGLAVAILLDATLVRSVLVPASMEVLGRGNWYLPPFLSWLPDLRVEPAEESSAH